MSIKFEHRVYSPWSQRIYWQEQPEAGRIAGTAETATRCVVQVGPDMYYQNFEFAWPAERGEVEKLEWMLEAAYGLGIGTAKKEIREVLGVKEPRQ